MVPADNHQCLNVVELNQFRKKSVMKLGTLSDDRNWKKRNHRLTHIIFKTIDLSTESIDCIIVVGFHISSKEAKLRIVEWEYE